MSLLRVKPLAVLLAVSVFLYGCGVSPASSSDTSSSSSDVVFGCGSTDGVDDMVSDVLSDTGSTLEEVSVKTSRFATDLARVGSVCEYVTGRVDALSVSSGVDEIDRVSALLEGLASSPQASARFITALGGDKLVDRMNLTQQFYRVPSYPTMDHPQSRYASVLKKVFITAQPRLSSGQSVDLARDMAQQLSTTRTTAMSWLLYDAQLTSEFLIEFGGQLEHYEHTHTTTTTSAGAGVGGVDWLWVKPASTRFKVLFPARVRDAWYDPATSFMSALAHNRQAALAFFKPGGDGEFARQEYWIQNRPWNHDGFTSILAALHSATASLEVLGKKEASDVASSTVGLLAARARELEDSDELLMSQFSPQASVHYASILNAYMPAIGNYYNNIRPFEHGRSWEPLEPVLGMTLLPAFNGEDLSLAFQLAAAHNEGLALLRQGVSAYEDAYLSETLKSILPQTDLSNDAIVFAFKDIAAFEGFTVQAMHNIDMSHDNGNNEILTQWANLSTVISQEGTTSPRNWEAITESLKQKDHTPAPSTAITIGNDSWPDAASVSLNIYQARVFYHLFTDGYISIDNFLTYVKPTPQQKEHWLPNNQPPSIHTIATIPHLHNTLTSFVENNGLPMSKINQLYEFGTRF